MTNEKTIHVYVESGVVQDVKGMPKGYDWKLHDADDEEAGEAQVTAEDRSEIERLVAKGFRQGRLDCDEDTRMKFIVWEATSKGIIKIKSVWYD